MTFPRKENMKEKTHKNEFANYIFLLGSLYTWYIATYVDSCKAMYWHSVVGLWFQVVYPGADWNQHCLGAHCAVSTKWAALWLHAVHHQLLGTTHRSCLPACYFLQESQWAGRYHSCMYRKAHSGTEIPTLICIFSVGKILFHRGLRLGWMCFWGFVQEPWDSHEFILFGSPLLLAAGFIDIIHTN